MLCSASIWDLGNSPAFCVHVSPDTGATITLMSYNTAVRHNVNINKIKTVHLFIACGNRMCVKRVAKMRVNKNDIFAEIDVTGLVYR